MPTGWTDDNYSTTANFQIKRSAGFSTGFFSLFFIGKQMDEYMD
jgi:hypothetical protein